MDVWLKLKMIVEEGIRNQAHDKIKGTKYQTKNYQDAFRPQRYDKSIVEGQG